MPVRIATVLLSLALTACGSSSDEPTSSGSTGGDEPVSSGETCEGYSMGDACVDDANFAQCQDMAAQCPGEVQVMESCPLQFSCPSGGESPGGDEPVASPEQCNGHTADEDCMGEEAFAQCQEMEAQCPGEIVEAESCPLQFSCP